MITKAFSLFDLKTGIFGVPFFMAHVAQARRACEDLANDLNTTVGRHPGDYMLTEIGTFDDASGAFSVAGPVHHFTMASLVRSTLPPSLFPTIDHANALEPVAFAGEAR